MRPMHYMNTIDAPSALYRVVLKNTEHGTKT